eukprot:TRINITY_DN3566_c0_g1_i3.p1 TRINITY_DN3566_c0_g1~~TRINITY_DN3566_c0_g1_i3.p1  ORF type:complete len:553 (-),score=146.63 TRINITY_DN3566_c0_g1_i3:526-2184(-)
MGAAVMVVVVAVAVVVVVMVKEECVFVVEVEAEEVQAVVSTQSTGGKHQTTMDVEITQTPSRPPISEVTDTGDAMEERSVSTISSTTGQVKTKKSTPNLWKTVQTRTIGQSSIRPRYTVGHSCGIPFMDAISPNRSLVGRLTRTKELKYHRGCVNTVTWSPCGNLLVSGGDDTHCAIWDMCREKLLLGFPTGHMANIFCAKFVPMTDNKRIITCAGDYQIKSFLLSESGVPSTRVHLGHTGRVKKLSIFPDDPNIFLSCSEDGTVRLFDLRESSKKGKILVNLKPLDINSIDLHGVRFCIGGGDPILRVYDLRSNSAQLYANFAPPHLARQAYRSRGHITGVSFSKDGKEILGSYSSDDIFLFDLDHTTRCDPSLFSTKRLRRRYRRNEELYCSEEDSVTPVVAHTSTSTSAITSSASTSTTNTHSSFTITTTTTATATTTTITAAPITTTTTTTTTTPTTTTTTTTSTQQVDFFFKQRYSGHCNVQTVKCVSFYGPNSEYVCSGSDDGRIFIWDKKSGKIVNYMKGDSTTVNVISGHPFYPVLATSGLTKK